ncbi:hypothetical protein QQX98_004567 [Neonectria punicea]|uniref:Fungal N-terminal domain-containing protein n=1 Tax=Neonectria punicea TaxID=979145 RepID=A0ABR1H8M6_9HYPO
MDPLSIAAGAAGLATGCVTIVSTLYTWIDDTIEVDQNVSSLCDEINGLLRVLESISNASVQASQVVIAEIDPEGNLWTSVMDTLGDIKGTLRKLDLLLASIEKTSRVFSRGFLRKPTKQMKLSMRTKDIATYRNRVQAHSTAMASALQMINLCLLLQSNSSQENLFDVLSGLKRQVGRIEVTLRAEPLDNDSLFEMREEDDRISRNLQNLIHVAESFHSSASTIIRDGARSTVWEGSMLGEPLSEEQLFNIESWIPPPIPEEGTNSSRTYANSVTTAGAGHNSDSDDDIDLEFAKRLEELALRSYRTGDHEKAETFYRRAIDRGQASHRSTHDIAKMRISLAYSCIRQGKWTEAEGIVSLMAFERKASDILVFHAMHALAMSSLESLELDAAHRYCKRALWGKRKLMGKNHPSCWDSSMLLASICTARGDIASAEAHQSFIPSSYQVIADSSALAYLDRSAIDHRDNQTPFTTNEPGSSSRVETSPSYQVPDVNMALPSSEPEPSIWVETSSFDEGHTGALPGLSHSAMGHRDLQVPSWEDRSRSSSRSENSFSMSDTAMVSRLSLGLSLERPANRAWELSQTLADSNTPVIDIPRPVFVDQLSQNELQHQPHWPFPMPKEEHFPQFNLLLDGPEFRDHVLVELAQKDSVPNHTLPPVTESYSKRQLAVGINYGIAETVVSFAFAYGCRTNETPITKWPGAKGHTEFAVPTVLYFDQHQKVVGWGHDTADALTPMGDLKPGIQEMKMFKFSGRDAIDTTWVYLYHLRLAICSVLQDMLGDIFTLEEENIHWHFTVPVLYNDDEKEGLRLAIKRAGYVRNQDDPRLTLVAEHIALLHYCVSSGLHSVIGTNAILVINLDTGMKSLVISFGSKLERHGAPEIW